MRHLLHNRDKAIRARSLQAVGILALDNVNELVTLLHSQDGIIRLPPHLRLTAEQQRLAGLWALAELQPHALIPVAIDIFRRYLAPNATFHDHYLMHEYARQICARLLEAGVDDFSEVKPSVVFAKLPRRSSNFESDYSTGRCPPYPLRIFNRDFEYSIEHLARLFRIPSVRVIQSIQRIIDRLPNLSSEDQVMDDWIESQNYGRINSRSLIPAREEVARHAYRTLQGRWFFKRTADSSYLEAEDGSYSKRGEFDPWLPSLFSHEVKLPFSPPEDKNHACAEWFVEDPPNLTDHILQDNMINVHEFVSTGVSRC